MIATSFELEGFRIVRHLEVLRGLTVSSRSVIGNIGAGVQALVGGNITLYTELAEKARSESFKLMVQYAAALGANAIIGMRYDANEIADRMTKSLPMVPQSK